MLALWIFAPLTLHAAPDSAGTEFYFAFQPNYGNLGTNRSLFLSISGKQDTQGTVTIPGLNFIQPFVVQANKVTTVAIPVAAMSLGEKTIAKLGVHVVAQNEITVYGANLAYASSDAFLAFPVDVLGLEYIAMSYTGLWYSTSPKYDFPSQIAVIGVFDNTTVTITPSVESRGRPAGIPFTASLNSGDTYQISGTKDADLTGTIITSSAPVAVMSGASMANVPIVKATADHLVEMMPPVSTWGKSFLSIPLATRMKGDNFRILASQDNTAVKINGAVVATLNRGKFYETVLTDRSQIETSAPTLVAQYSTSFQFDGVIDGAYNVNADPFMILIPPTEQFLRQYTFSAISGFSPNFVNIVAPSSSIISVTLDGTPVNSALFTTIGSSGFSGAQVQISTGAHVISSDAPLGIYVYGFGYANSYGYPGGMSFQPINQGGDSFAPNVKLNQVGDTIQGIATDSEDINANGLLDAGEDLNNNGIIDRRGNNVPNSNGIIDQDTGIFKVELEAGATNLKLDRLPFVPGALTAYFSISLLDPKLPGSGVLRVADGVGNLTKSPISLFGVPTLKDVRLIDTISTNTIDIDSSSYSKTPYSINVVGDRTVIEWRFDSFPADSFQDLGLDLVIKNPAAGEQRLISHKLELTYVDPNGKQVRTELDPQYARVLNSAFDSTITSDKSAYPANENVLLNVRVNNLSEYARTIDARIIVEDSQGILAKEVALLPTQSLTSGTIKEFANLAFNTGSILAGDYRAHLFLSENNRQVGESIATFKIQPTMTLNSKVTTDKASYSANERVAIKANIQSLSPNYIFSALTAKTSIVNDQGLILFTDAKTIPQLATNQTVELATNWNSAVFPKGAYTVKSDVFDGATLLSTTQSTFAIVGSTVKATGVTGTVSMLPSSIEFGSDGTITFSLANKGNEEIPNATVKLLIVDPDSTQVIKLLEPMKSIVVPAIGSLTGQVVLPTAGLTLKSYLVVMQLEQPGSVNSLASSSFAVKDTTPPIVIIVIPVKDTLYSSPVNLSIIAADNASGMERVEYQIYDGIWNSLPVADPAIGKYALSWQPAVADNGVRTVKFRGFDLAGNQSNPISVTFTVDTIPPVLTVSTLSDGSYTNKEVLNISGTVRDNSGVASLDVNCAVVSVAGDGSFSQALLLKNPDNTVEVKAIDMAGNKAVDSRTIHFDQKAPNLTIDAPADNSKTAISPIEVKGSVDETSTVTSKLNGIIQPVIMDGNRFSATVLPEPRWNTIEITATDLAGNTSSQKRSVLFDDQRPSLAITEPSQDIRTNKSSMTISGKVSDPYSAVGLTVAMDGVILTPPVVNDIFSQIVIFTDEKLYPITITASNEIGTQTIAQRNIIFDKTPPNMTIDPVCSPTNASSQIVKGTREDGAIVVVSCATATVGAVEYPTTTSWRMSLAGMQEGENRLQATATDLADNRTTANATILYVPKAPEVTISASPNQIWPPNKKLVPVVIAGNVATFGVDVRDVTVSVADEYGKYNLQGLKLGDTVLLEAWRDGNDMDGRVYTITAVVTDQAGNRTTKSTAVIVPHDMGK